MIEHEYNISKSIKLNIIGTSNIVIACKKFNIKLIYFSTSYIYPGKKEIIKKLTQFYPVTIMHGLKLSESRPNV